MASGLDLCLDFLLRNGLIKAVEGIYDDLGDQTRPIVSQSKRLKWLLALTTIKQFLTKPKWDQEDLSSILVILEEEVYGPQAPLASLPDPETIIVRTKAAVVLFPLLQLESPDFEQFEEHKSKIIDVDTRDDTQKWKQLDTLKRDIASLHKAMKNFDTATEKSKKTINDISTKYDFDAYKSYVAEEIDRMRNSIDKPVLEKIEDDIQERGYRPGHPFPSQDSKSTANTTTQARPQKQQKTSTATTVQVPPITVDELRRVVGDDKYAEIWKGNDNDVKQFLASRKRRLEDPQQPQVQHNNNNNNNDNENDRGEDVSAPPAGSGVFSRVQDLADDVDDGTEVITMSKMPRTLTQQSPRKQLDSGARGRRPWGEDEVENLYRGVALKGVGHWAEILGLYSFGDRSSVDLKDKWRLLTKKGDHERRMQAAIQIVRNDDGNGDDEEMEDE